MSRVRLWVLLAFPLVDAMLSSRRCGAVLKRTPLRSRLLCVSNPNTAGDSSDNVFGEAARPPTEHDIRSIEERQLEHKASVAAVPCVSCKHGFPQAFFSDPTRSKRLHSSTVRLTCPWLVKHIDEYEAEGGVRKFNEILLEDNELAANLRGSMEEANEVHTALRERLFSDPEGQRKVRDKARLVVTTKSSFSIIATKLEGHRKEAKVDMNNGVNYVDAIMSSGFIGVSSKNVDDVKCLHAHTADFLLRGRNAVGQEALKRLEIDPTGGDDCWQQCDYRVPMTDESWHYRSVKNRSKLKNRLRLRNVRKRKGYQSAEAAFHTE